MEGPSAFSLANAGLQKKIHEAHQAALNEAESLKGQIDTLSRQCNAKARALSKQDEDHKQALFSKDQKNAETMAKLKELHNKEKVCPHFMIIVLAN